MLSLLRKATIGAVAAVSLAGAAQASTVNITGTVGATGAVNNFAAQLAAALPGGAVLLDFASITTVGAVKLTFTAVGAESGFDNSFFATGAGSLSESGPNFGFTSILLTTLGQGSISGVFSGLLDGLLSFDNGHGLVAGLGTLPFGVFASGGAGAHSVFFLAFDDQNKNPDDNHDDFLIRVDVSEVPLPAGGLLLIGGLGMLAAARRRKATAA